MSERIWVRGFEPPAASLASFFLFLIIASGLIQFHHNRVHDAILD